MGPLKRYVSEQGDYLALIGLQMDLALNPILGSTQDLKHVVDAKSNANRVKELFTFGGNIPVTRHLRACNAQSKYLS